MRPLYNDEYKFDPDMETAEVSCPEDAVLAPEDTLAPEFGGTAVSAEESHAERHETVKRLFLMPLAGVVAVLSVVLASFNVDPLGSDFLMATAATPSGSATDPSVVTKTPKILPSLTGIVTYVYHVTYAPTGDAYDATCTDESDMDSDVRSWVSGKGGDPDTVVLYDYVLTSDGYETSPDFAYVGDLDDFDNIMIISGTIDRKYTLEVWYEGYAKEAADTPSYSDAFPVLPNLDPDFEGNYAWSLLSPSPGFEGGTEEYLIVDSAYLVAGTWYTDRGETTSDVPGASYDRATNTLTLRDFHGSVIEANLMGNGFTIELIGDNSVGTIQIWGAMYGGSVTFTGTGSITVNEGRSRSEGIYLQCERSPSCLMIDRGATVEVYGEHAIVINETTLEQGICTLAPITVTGGTCASGEFVEYSLLVTDADGNIVFDENGQPVMETATVKDMSERYGMALYDYSVVDADGKPASYVKFAPAGT